MISPRYPILLILLILALPAQAQHQRVVAWGDNTYGQTNIPVEIGVAIDIATGYAHSLALKDDGTVFTWGGAPGSSIPPDGVTGVQQLAAGRFHSLALHSSGFVTGFGNNGNHQLSIPSDLSNVVQIAAGEIHSLALKTDGTVVAWGGQDAVHNYGQAIVPPTATNVVQVAAGPYHSLALRSDGTIIGWGLNFNGQLNVPAGLTDVVQIDAGRYHSLALKADGTIVAWGGGSNGQLDVPAGLTGVTQISVGYEHNLALKTDGTVVAWGWNSNNQVTTANTLEDVVQVSAGPTHNLAIYSDGTVYAWGNPGSPNDGRLNIPVSVENAVKVVADPNSIAVVNADGRVISWGANEPNYYQQGMADIIQLQRGGNFWTGLRSNGTVTTFPAIYSNSLPPGLSNVVQISRSGGYLLALRADGTIVQGIIGGAPVPLPPDLDGNAVQVASGGNFGLAIIVDGTVVGWGDSTYGQTLPPWGLTNVVQIAADTGRGLALTEDGTVVVWGNNPNGEATVPENLTDAVYITASGQDLAALRIDGTVVYWGRDFYDFSPFVEQLSQVEHISINQVGGAAVIRHPDDPSIFLHTEVTPQQPVVEPGATAAFDLTFRDGDNLPVSDAPVWARIYRNDVLIHEETLASFNDGAYTFQIPADAGHGEIFEGRFRSQHPDYTYTLTRSAVILMPNDPPTAAQITSPTSGTEVFVEADHPGTLPITWTTSIDPDGDDVSYVWQASVSADFGEPFLSVSTTETSAEVILGDLAELLATSTPPGETQLIHHRVLSTDGRDTTAGPPVTILLRNAQRVAAWGLSPQGQTTVPFGLHDAVDVASGYYHTLALHDDGTVTAWGLNDHGQATVPTGLSGVVQIDAGRHSLALHDDGTVTAWGPNDHGQTSVPAGLTDVVQIAAGFDHNIALKADGSLVGWGRNNFGQSNIPPDLNDVVLVSAGGWHSLALKADGTIVVWGGNQNGQLNIPPDLSDVIYATAGANSTSVAIKADGTIVAWGYPNYGQTEVPDELDDVVHVIVGDRHAIALKGDGTLVTWGTGEGNDVPDDLGNVVGITGGGNYSVALLQWPDELFPLIRTHATAQTPEVATGGTASFDLVFRDAADQVITGAIPIRVRTYDPLGDLIHNEVTVANDGGTYDFLVPLDVAPGDLTFSFIAQHEDYRYTRAGITIIQTINNPPTAADITTPADGTEIVVTGEADEFVTVAWTVSTDPDGHDVSYVWEASLSDDFADVVLTVATTETSTEVSMADLAKVMDTTEPADVWPLFHRVVATDGALTTTGPSVVMNLVYSEDNKPPTASEITSPEDGAEIIVDADSGGSVSIVWTVSTDPDGDEVSYIWQASLDEDFAELAFGISTSEAATTVSMADLSQLMDDAAPGDVWPLFHRVLSTDGVFTTTGPSVIMNLRRSVGTEDGQIPESFTVKGLYPNPAISQAQVMYDLPEAAEVLVEIFDVMGRSVLTYDAGHVSAGANQAITIHTSTLSAGAYIYRLTANAEIATGRFTVVR